MPRKRNLRANTGNKNRYGEPLFGSITPRKKTPKKVTPVKFTRQGYTPAAITPNHAQAPREKVKLHPPPPGYSFIAQKQWMEYRLKEKKKGETTSAKIKGTTKPKPKGQKARPKRSKN